METISTIRNPQQALHLPEPAILYLDYLEAAGRSPATLLGYRRVFTRLARFTQGQMPDPLAIRDTLDSIASTNTRSVSLTILRQFFKFLRARGLSTTDPTAGIPYPKRHRKAYAGVSADELHRITEALKNDRLMQTLTIVLYYVGTRISETCAMRVEHVSFDGECGVIEFPKRKGGNAGFATFGPEVAIVLRPWLAGREGWIFPHPVDPSKPMSINTAENRLVAAGRKAKIPGRMNPHRLRHCYITRAVEAGWPQLALQQQVGHSNPAATAVYYRPSRTGLLNLTRRLQGHAPTDPTVRAPEEMPLVAASTVLDGIRTQLQFLTESQAKILELLGQAIIEKPRPGPSLPENLERFQRLLYRLGQISA